MAGSRTAHRSHPGRGGCTPPAGPDPPKQRPGWRDLAKVARPFDPAGQDVTAPSKRLRYEILRRDNHTCRYCGASAPEASLTVDHVTPVALGGSNDPANLVAACVECNGGKSASAPDASLVADVSADALRWGRALREAAEYLLHEYGDRVDHHERFETCWSLWTCGGKPVRLPHNWSTSVDSFVAAGLPVEILFDCIEIAMSAKHVAPENTFRYMCGVAWKKVAELREIAAALLEADGA